SEINNNLQRVRELTVQATTGTNSDSDLSSIQDEIKSRLDEIDRVSGQTQFNGVNVLAKDGSMKIQVGANDGQTVSIDLQKIDSSALGLKGFSVSGNALKVGDALTSIPGATAPVAIDFGDATAVGSIAKTLGVTDNSGLSLHNILDKDGKATNTYVIQSGSNSYSASVTAGGTVTLNTTNVTYDDPANGVTAAKQTGQPIKVTTNSNGEAVGYVSVQGKDYLAGVTGTGKDAVANGQTAAIATTLRVSDDPADATKLATTTFTGTATSDPLALLDKAIASVDKFRSSLGAVQNRLDSAVTNLNNTTTNLSEAQSRIQDADYATEVSNMSKAQIIQQAGNSVLSKANQVPQQVLSLLQG
ncbi:flagellin, partial [Escherichia albertii]|nr:flagellin [Escherichia albertii]